MKQVFKATLVVAALTWASPSLAAHQVSGEQYFKGTFSGMDCPVTTGPLGGFTNCWATQNGVVASQPTNDPTASLVVAKYGSDGEFEKNSVWTSFTQDDVTISSTSSLLSFTYNMDAGDPVLKYITIKQATNDYALFYNPTGFVAGTTYTFDLTRFSPDGWSHLTVYDSAGPVPEPGTWALMLLGFGAIGFSMRRRRNALAVPQMA